MGSGGARAGSGPKPRNRIAAFVSGARGVAAPTVAVVPAAPVVMPVGMPLAQQAVWLELAPHAIAAGTLTAGTAASFVRLCGAVVRLARWQAQVERDGDTLTMGEGMPLTIHPLVPKALALEKDVRVWSKDFAISPFGKAQPSLVPVALDPFAEFDSPLQVLQGGKV